MKELPSIAFLGEALLELAPSGQAQNFRLGVAGDIFNTAAAVAQLGVPSNLVTAVGDIATDQIFFDRAEALAISTKFVQRDRSRHAGLYLINNDENGERSFVYWRSNSAARHLFGSRDQLDQVLTSLRGIPYWYFSGITLALLSSESLEVLIKHLIAFRHRGGKVVYDNNYRPALWASAAHFRSTDQLVLPQVDIFLPSLDDAISSGVAQSETEALARFRSLAVPEIVLKNGTEPVVLLYEGSEVSIPVKAQSPVVDTTGAGDGFNGGYLAARLLGHTPAEAVQVGMRVSGTVVCHRGAILPPEQWQALRQCVFDKGVRI